MRRRRTDALRVALFKRSAGARSVMPGTNGASLVKIVRNLRPGLRILMMTGHARLQAGEEIGTENIIRKPFNVARHLMNDWRVLARGYRFPAEIIGHAAWLYFRFPLGLRMVE